MQDKTYTLRVGLARADANLEAAADQVAGIADGEEADGPLTSAVQMIQEAQSTLQRIARELHYRELQAGGRVLCDAAEAVLALYAEMTPGAAEDMTNPRIITLMEAMDAHRITLGIVAGAAVR